MFPSTLTGGKGMNKYEFKSKYYIRKRNVAYIVLNISVVIVSILSLISIFTKGVHVSNISPIIISLVVSFLLKNKFNIGKYINCIANATINENSILIDYNAFSVEFFWNDIIEVQYSNKLQCAKIVGKYYRYKNTKKEFMDSPYYLYINEKEELLTIIENKSKIIYIDL